MNKNLTGGDFCSGLPAAEKALLLQHGEGELREQESPPVPGPVPAKKNTMSPRMARMYQQTRESKGVAEDWRTSSFQGGVPV